MADRDQLQVLGLERVRFGRHSRCNDRLEASADGASKSRSGEAARSHRGLGSESLLTLVIDFHQAPFWFWGARTHLLEQRQLPRPARLSNGSGFGLLQRSLHPSCSRACVVVPIPGLLEFSLTFPQLCPICFPSERFASGSMDPAYAVPPIVSKRRSPDGRHSIFLSDEDLRTLQLAEQCRERVKTKE